VIFSHIIHHAGSIQMTKSKEQSVEFGYLAQMFFAKNNYVYLFSLNHIHFKLHLNMEHEDTEKIFRSGEFVGTESLYKFGVISPYLEPVGSYGEISCPDSVTARNGQTFSRWYSPQQPRWHGRKGDGPVITLHGSWDR